MQKNLINARCQNSNFSSSKRLVAGAASNRSIEEAMLQDGEDTAATTSMTSSSSPAARSRSSNGDAALQVLAMTASSEREKYHRHQRNDDEEEEEDGSIHLYNNSNSSSSSNTKSNNVGNVMMNSEEDDEEEDQSARSARSSGLSSGSEGDTSRSGSGGDGSKSKNLSGRSGGGRGGGTTAVINKVSKRTGLRKGKWTVEEEEYATRYIHYFSSGLLTLPEGTTLRASLADKLHCDPMRITKKYAGASCLGSKISRSLVGVGERPMYTSEEVECARMDLRQLDARFQMRLMGGGNGNGGAPLSPSNGGNNNNYGSAVMPPPQSSMFDLSTYAGVRLAASNSGVSLLSKSSNDGSKMMSNATFPITPAASISNSLLASSYLASLADGNTDQSLASSATAGFNLNAVPSPILNNHTRPMSMMMQGMNGQAGSINNVTTASLTSNNSISGVGSNEQLVQTLLLQIAMQLQALATLSPSTLRQIQLQILAATLSSSPDVATAVPVMQQQMPVASSSPPEVAASSTAAIAAQFQTTAAATATTNNVHPSPTVEVRGSNSSNDGAAAAAILAQFQQQLMANARQVGVVQPPGDAPLLPSTTAMNSSVTAGQPPAFLTTLSLPPATTAIVAAASGLQQLAANARQVGVQAVLPPTSAATTSSLVNATAINGGHHFLPVIQAAATSADHLIPLASCSASLTSQSDQVSLQGSVGCSVRSDIAVAPPMKQEVPTPPIAQDRGNNMVDFLAKLKAEHAKALEQARREQTNYHQDDVRSGRDSNTSNEEGGSASPHPITKKQKLVALLPFEHATTVSSGSGTTVNGSSTTDGSTSSSNEHPRTTCNDEETRNDGSTSSNTTMSYSEEDSNEDDNHIEQLLSKQLQQKQSSVPQCGSLPHRKRFRCSGGSSSTESDNMHHHVNGGITGGRGGGGITRRNLEDHNVRMAAEDKKNQDK